MDELFKYIHKRDGKYLIRKTKNDCWGRFKNIEDALHTRDLLIDCDWDIGELIARDEIENGYKNMDLPSFDDYVAWKNRMKYITKQNINGKLYYVIQKRMDGRVKRFGYYKTLNEAFEKKKELIKNGWRI